MLEIASGISGRKKRCALHYSPLGHWKKSLGPGLQMDRSKAVWKQVESPWDISSADCSLER